MRRSVGLVRLGISGELSVQEGSRVSLSGPWGERGNHSNFATFTSQNESTPFHSGGCCLTQSLVTGCLKNPRCKSHCIIDMNFELCA